MMIIDSSDLFVCVGHASCAGGAMQVMDAWVELSTGARVNLIIEYEPNGKEPEVVTY
jgi:hypothetical protein